ncbi:MAG TPA: ATP-binding protein [Thermoanaerobaculia bacterium]|nr:ATP-binding protein [Thermoanaerobaculia bacterium]
MTLLSITATAIALASYFYFASRRARAILESATEAMLVVDESGRIRCVNGAAERMFGYGTNALRGEPLTLVIPDSHGLFERHGSRRFERIAVTREETSAPVELSVGEFAVDGRPRFVLTVRDIDARKRTEEVLRETEGYVQLLVGRLPVIVWVADNRGVVQSMFGSGITSWRETNLPLDDLFSGDDAGALREAHEHGLRGESVRRELKMNGRTFLVAIDPYRNGGGEIRGTTGVAFDSTDRAELLERLQRAAREWRETFDAVDSPVLIFDDELRLERLNRAAASLVDTEPVEMIERTAVELKDAGGVLAEAAEIALQIAATESDDIVLTNRISAAGRMWVVQGNPIETMRGRGVCVIATDVTELTTMEEALRSAEAMSRLGTFVAGVAHEVRNPLFGISAAVDALDAVLEGPELREYAAGLRQEVRRMTELMSDLLTYGRPAEPSRERSSLESVVRASASAVRALAQQQRVSIDVAAANDLHDADIDRSRVQQVFENLLKNAIAFSPRGSVVEIDCRNVEVNGTDCIECIVADHGPGIADDDLPRVFEPFFTHRRGGTGLGLAIVDRIVREHHGQVVLANRPDGGAVATVRLPAASVESLVDA